MPTNMKNVIADTFFQMVKERGIDKVTVKDLVETCHISRQTFYYHFQDILGVVEWAAKKGAQEALKASLSIHDPEEAIRAFVEAEVNNYDITLKLLQSQKREYIERIFVEAIHTYLEEMIRSRAPGLAMDPEEASVALRFYAYGISGVMLDQCGRGDCDPDKLAKQILRLLRGDHFRSLSED